MRQSAFVNAAIAIIFVAVLALITVGVAALLSPPPLPAEITPLPTFVGALPTETPTTTATSTPTATASLPPSFTPRPSATSTPTPTATFTLLPSATPLLSSQTPSLTWTPSATPTPTETPIPFPFIAQGEPVLSANTVNSLGCAWQGIGGQVFNAVSELTTEQALGLYARVISDQLDRRVRLGSNSLYGQNTGWEMSLGSRSTEMLVYVRLETEDGRPRSPDVLVRFTGDCTANLARVNLTVNPRFGP